MIQQEISQYITELLYKHDRLSIPGLGSLEMDHESANLDQIQGQISAPSKRIKFNDNLVMDDGVLMEYIMNEKKWPVEQCQLWIKEQVDSIKTALEKREIVELTGLGRFFKNYEHQLQFVAESNNYNTDSYGLQAVMAQTVNHNIEERSTLITSIDKNKQERDKKANNKQSTWLKSNLWWLILAGIVILALVILLLVLQTKNQQTIVDNDVPQERLNTSPSKTIDKETTPILPKEEPIVDDFVEQEQEPTLPPEEPVVDTEEPSVFTEEHTAIIAVGLFKEQPNVQDLLEDLNKRGFSAVTQIEGDLTRVGVSIRFEEEEELRKVLREVRRKYTKSAFVMFRDGVRVK